MEEKPKKDPNEQEKGEKNGIDRQEGRSEMKDCESLIDLGGAPPLELNNLYYNCAKCSSPIVVTLIDEKNNEIEFKCHEHQLKMDIGEYIEKMKRYKDNKICIY